MNSKSTVPLEPRGNQVLIQSFLSAVFEPDNVVEVRIPKWNKFKQTASGYFNSPEKLADGVSLFDGKANVYVTLNAVNPALLARSNNRIKQAAQHTTSDSDINSRRWFGIDIDPDRPSGISSTNEELAHAKFVLESLCTGLSSRGWPEPAVLMSGNGYWALYRIELPNDEQSKTLLKSVLEKLGQEFDIKEAHIDRTVYNAARIMPLPGTQKVKGDETRDRPHRQVELISVPDDFAVVDVSQLEQVSGNSGSTSESPRVSGVVTERRSPLLSDLLTANGIEFEVQDSDAAGVTWYHVRQCPFHDDGRPFECGVGQMLTSGKFAGHCFHPEGVNKGWQEWKRALHLELSPPTGGSESNGTIGTFPPTDAGNAELFAEMFGDDLRFDHRRGKWFTWSGSYWTNDVDGGVFRNGKQLARERIRRAADLDDSSARKKMVKWGLHSESRPRIEATLALARNEFPITEAGDRWDTDPWLLGVENGVVDLKTGKHRPGMPEDRILLHTDISYDPAATCKRFEKFLNEIFDGDHDLVNFVHSALGYSITGDTREQVVFMCY